MCSYRTGGVETGYLLVDTDFGKPHVTLTKQDWQHGPKNQVGIMHGATGLTRFFACKD
jgi:hypothetical protein